MPQSASRRDQNLPFVPAAGPRRLDPARRCPALPRTFSGSSVLAGVPSSCHRGQIFDHGCEAALAANAVQTVPGMRFVARPPHATTQQLLKLSPPISRLQWSKLQNRSRTSMGTGPIEVLDRFCFDHCRREMGGENAPSNLTDFHRLGSGSVKPALNDRQMAPLPRRPACATAVIALSNLVRTSPSPL